MKVLNFSSFARVIDPRYPTNLAILVIATLCGSGLFIFNLYEGNEIFHAVAAAFSFSVSVFLTWAVGRELDPEHELAAFAGLLLIIPGYLFLDTPNLIMVLTMLLLLRMLNRTTGLQPKLLDSLSIIAFGSILILRGAWIYGFLCAGGLFLDSKLSEPLKRNLLFSGLMAALTIISIFIFKPSFPNIEIIPGLLFFVIGAILLFIPLIINTRQIDIVCDFQPEKLNPLRVQTGQIFSISAAVIVWLLAGGSGIIDLLPLWSAILGVSVVYILSTLSNKVLRKTGNS